MKKILFAVCVLFAFKGGPAYAIDVSAEAACLICADTGEVIFAKNENRKMSPASTTKIMTGLLAAECGRLSDAVTVSERAQNQEGSSLYLREGEKIKLEDLLYGLMLNSGNDAAVAIAEHLSGDCKSFAEKMTMRAFEIGAKNTVFKNPNGLEEPGHRTSAYDLALMGAAAMKNDIFASVVSAKNKTAEISGGKILHFKNHNKLLSEYDGCAGIKTGFTKSAGRCLVSAAERNGVMLVAVTLGAPDDWNDHKKMLDYGFEKAFEKTILKKGEVLKRIEKKEYTFSAKEDATAGTVSGRGFRVEVCMPDELPGGIARNEKVGEAIVFFGKKAIDRVDIVSDCDIREGIFIKTGKIFRAVKGILKKFSG